MGGGEGCAGGGTKRRARCMGKHPPLAPFFKLHGPPIALLNACQRNASSSISLPSSCAPPPPRPLPPPARLGPFSPRAARPPPWSLPSTSLVLSLNHTNLIYSTATQVLPIPPLPPPPPPARAVAFATAVAVPARAVAADSGPGGEGEGCVSLHGWAAPGGPRRRVPSGGAACRDEH